MEDLESVSHDMDVSPTRAASLIEPLEFDRLIVGVLEYNEMRNTGNDICVPHFT